MAKPVKGKTKFNAYAYRAYTPDFEKPLAPATVPGPLIEAEVGDTVVVHFRNKLTSPVTMHPHGIFYSNEMDGAYKGKFTDPGGFVQQQPHLHLRLGGDPRDRGDLALPRPRADGPAAGLQGPVRPADRSATRAKRSPTSEFFLAFHTLDPSTTGLRAASTASTAGPTPATRRPWKPRSASGSPSTSTARRLLPHLPPARPPLAGTRRARSSTTRPSGPADSFTARIRRGQPGPLVLPLPRLPAPAQGMNGWYLVS